jgi:DNA-binding transcriptional LysR family regulator
MYDELFIQQGLSLERLNALVLLSEHGSLIKAARGDFGLQSRYSHYLREMSAFFGTELTIRAGKSIRLTPAGEELALMAREQFQSLLQFRYNARNEPHAFRIGANDSLLQYLVIPTIGPLRRPDRPLRLILQNLRTNEIVSRLQEQRLDFGIVRSDAVPKGLKSEPVCTVKYAVIVPERLVAQRGLLTLKKALLDCPHAALGTDGQMTQRIQQLAQKFNGQFRPELICESLANCIAAVRSGYYAALVPLLSWTSYPEMPCHVVEDTPLEILDRNVVLTWHPRLMEVRDNAAERMKNNLLAALRMRGVDDD